MIARAATAQDDITGDGTTSTVLLIGELLKQSERYLAEDVHPRVLCDGFEAAKLELLRLLDSLKVPVDLDDKELLYSVARTSLRTKVLTIASWRPSISSLSLSLSLSLPQQALAHSTLLIDRL
jgi:T-complex protein 1 subunit zeta